MRALKLFTILWMLLGVVAFTQIKAQTTVWQFDGGDGKGGIRIIEKGYEIAEVQLLLTNGAWGKASIEYIEDDSDTYMRIKYNSSISEIYVYWYDDKLVQVWSDGKEKAYWLKK
jgi:hypothetical protein